MTKVTEVYKMVCALINLNKTCLKIVYRTKAKINKLIFEPRSQMLERKVPGSKLCLCQMVVTILEGGSLAEWSRLYQSN